MYIFVLMLPECFGGTPMAITSPKPPPFRPESAILTKIVPFWSSSEVASGDVKRLCFGSYHGLGAGITAGKPF